MKRQMTFKQWRAALGEALTIPDAAKAIKRRPADLARAAARGQLAVHRFRSLEGQAYYLIRVPDLLDYHQRSVRLSQGLTPEGMRRAFSKMAAS